MKKEGASAAKTPTSPPRLPAPTCDFDKLFDMKNGAKCTSQWTYVREILHPSQQAVGYAAVKRKVQKDYKTMEKAQKRMNEAGSELPFVLGPGNVPYLVDSHHTAMALEASGFHSVNVTMTKVCDWRHMKPETFFETMKQENFMNGVGRHGDDLNILPVPVDVSPQGGAIPPRMMDLTDDPWRSFAALVRKVRDKKHCPKNNPLCLRGYRRECEANGHLTPFFEFRWAYFLNDAFQRGCSSSSTSSSANSSYWDNASDCQQFERAYKEIMANNAQHQNLPTSTPSTSSSSTCSILAQDEKAWKDAAKLLIPLCRGKVAQIYTIPDSLRTPIGGQSLPGRVAGKHVPIAEPDPFCAAPTCPTLPRPLLPDWFTMTDNYNRQQHAADASTCSNGPK